MSEIADRWYDEMMSIPGSLSAGGTCLPTMEDMRNQILDENFARIVQCLDTITDRLEAISRRLDVLENRG